MARAAAKRRPPVRHDRDRRRHKDSGGQRFEDTLFFNRLRKQAKWVFVFLALVFAGGFVLFGVGNSNLGSLGDIFNGIGGTSSGTSVKKELKKTQENPKDAQAWHDLAVAYESNNDLPAAIAAWKTYTTLRPKSIEGLSQLATDYQTELGNESQAAQDAANALQSEQPQTLGPAANTPLGKALASVSDPLTSASSTAATQRYEQALQTSQATANELVAVDAKIAKLQPTNATSQLQLAQDAQTAGDAATAIAAYRKVIKLEPLVTSQVAYAKQQIKALEAQLRSAPRR